MKLFRKIMIALLAACTVFSLTGCMTTAENMIDDVTDTASNLVSDVTSMIFPDPYPSSDIMEEVTSTVSETESFEQNGKIAGNFYDGFYLGYEDEKFVDLFVSGLNEKAAMNGWTDLTIAWQEGWHNQGVNPPEETELSSNEIPFVCCVMYDETDGSEVKIYYYLKYNAEDQEITAIRIEKDDGTSLKAKEAHAAVVEILEQN